MVIMMMTMHIIFIIMMTDIRVNAVAGTTVLGQCLSLEVNEKLTKT